MKSKNPTWFLILIIAVALPVAGYPILLSQWPPADGYEMKFILWLYPAYVIASGIFAWICWPTRRLESWILLAFMVLSHLAMWSFTIM